MLALFGEIQGAIEMTSIVLTVGEWAGELREAAGSMNEESQNRDCYNIAFICTPTRKQCRLSPEMNT